MNRVQRCLLLIAGLSLGVRTGSAWGPAGHEIVGRIAAQHLTATTANFIHELLNTGNTNAEIQIADSSVANWADWIRKDNPETAPWHFVDIPFEADRYDPARDCCQPAGCVVEAVERFRQELADRRTNPAVRVAALKFLVHFVGDIHMPLHCAERHGDRGGNLVWVLWPGDSQATKLHAIWDSNLIESQLHDRQLTALAYAVQLNDSVPAARVRAWSAGTPADWAWESHQLAIAEIYGTIPESGPAHPLAAAAITKSQDLVAEQLTKAGLRLAELLNQLAANWKPGTL